MPRKALGRGLGALIPDPWSETETARIVELEVGTIRGNPMQPRRRWDEAALEELSASIKQHGVLQPVLVRRVSDGYELVAGERRWRAASRAGLGKVPAIVVEMNDDEAVAAALIENLQREDLGPLEEARAYRMLSERFGETQEQVAARVGKSRAQVANMLRLLALPDEVQALLEGGALETAHGKILAGVAVQEVQVRLARRCAEEGLTVRQLEELVARARQELPRARPAKPRKPPVYGGLEERLRERLGTKVEISGRGDRGAIRIEFYDREALERLVQLLVPEELAADVPRGTSRFDM